MVDLRNPIAQGRATCDDPAKQGVDLAEVRMLRTVHSFCRICSGGCGTLLTVDESDHIVEIRGDKEQPMSRGYACAKGLNANAAHHGPGRLLRPLKRTASGDFEEIGLARALDEIAERLKGIIGERGPNAFGMYVGGGAAFNAGWLPMQQSFIKAIGSTQLFSTLTIDQSAKVISYERMGTWAGGTHDLNEAEVILILGVNPLVSHGLPILAADPVRRIKRAKAAGTKIIVVDPRRTETAQFADLVLQPLPGQDVAIMAGLIRLVLANGWEDKAFCARHIGAERMADLRAAVAPFEAEMVERRAELAPGQLRAAAEMFARDARKGAAYAGTGPCMAPYGNTTQHLVDCLTFICGRVKRAGDRALTDMIGPNYPLHAEVVPPPRSYEAVAPSRIRGAGLLAGEKLTSTLAEEIMTPGEGQVRALFNVGANPIVGVPNQQSIIAAFRSLDLLVTIDPYMTETARLSDYVLPPVMMYERDDLPLSLAGYPLYPENWTQYTAAAIAPPADSDLMEETLMLWEIARRLGISIDYDGKQDLGLERAPTRDQLLEIRLRGSRFTLDALKALPSGIVVDSPELEIKLARPDAEALLDPMPADVAAEIAEFIGTDALPKSEQDDERPFFSHLLSSRRMRELFCSTGRHFPEVRKRRPYNPAFLAPAEMDALNLADGDHVRITSEFASVEAIVQADNGLRSGVVSMAHGFGGLDDDDLAGAACVNRLIDTRQHVEPINAMPRMSGIPVNIQAIN
jgi:anaerobic selenocysteine-containing dehydrogenase